ncbi:MAG: hypothetical protein ACR2QR_00710 [Woeseiaceae bacterium]
MRNQLIAERPNPDGPATDISLAVYINDIDVIDDVSQRFNIDMFINIAWQDSRLALPLDGDASVMRTIPASDVWTPRGLVLNDRGLEHQLPLNVDVDSMGNVVFRQRLLGELAVDLNFREFPFDTQQLAISVVSYQYTPDEIHLSAESMFDANTESFSAEGWQFRLLDVEPGNLEIPAAGIVRPQMTFVVEAQRNYQYYILTMFLPMSLIIFMSWTAFWIQPNVVNPRISISTASIFTLIALGFSIRLSLPQVSYVTRADLFVLGCTLVVFIALGVAVIGSRWAEENKLKQAVRLNATTRWVYLLLFFLVTVLAATL